MGSNSVEKKLDTEVKSDVTSQYYENTINLWWKEEALIFIAISRHADTEKNLTEKLKDVDAILNLVSKSSLLLHYHLLAFCMWK